MKKLLTTIGISALAVWSTLASASQPLQAYTRDSISLNGEWKIIVDPYENGYYNYRYQPFDQMENPPPTAYFRDQKPRHKAELIEYDFDKSKSLQVPSDWNTQNEKLYYYEGTVWYRKTFDNPSLENGERAFVYFGAANYRADVYLNGEKLGVHIGGFTPFHFEVTDHLREGENSLVVKVDNKRKAEGVPTLNTDWWNYGGLTRDVKLLVTPEAFIRDYTLALDSIDKKTISGEVLLDGAQAGQEVRLQLPELSVDQTLKVDAQGQATFTAKVPKAILWSPETPQLYDVVLTSGADKLTDKVGLRTVETRGKEILLNGKPIFLRGIALHEEYAVQGGGRVKSAEQAKQQLQWVKQLGGNFVRLAHYPHNEHIVRLADEMGLLLWSEIPVYWTIAWENEQTYENAENQLTEMILRDKNRASIIIWSLANETPVSEPRTQFLTRLAERARELDDTRLLSAAMEKHYHPDDPELAIVEDPLADVVDMVSFNEYIGWYDGQPEKATRVDWLINYDKPVFISEFGGGALQGYHGDKDTIWTEEYQAEIYRTTLDMLSEIDGWVGTSPWILTDFRSPRRHLPGIQDDFNRKGILSEKGVKKKAFDVLRDFYLKKADEY